MFAAAATSTSPLDLLSRSLQRDQRRSTFCPSTPARPRLQPRTALVVARGPAALRDFLEFDARQRKHILGTVDASRRLEAGLAVSSQNAIRDRHGGRGA